MNDRIKLAEAMKLPAIESVKKHGMHVGWFDPFTDANDDYLVLEWMRETESVYCAYDEIEHEWSLDYQIGEYARAALKVIE